MVTLYLEKSKKEGRAKATGPYLTYSLLARSDFLYRLPLFLPGLDTAIQVGNILIAHPL